jgi:hypothetical protein
VRSGRGEIKRRAADAIGLIPESILLRADGVIR